MFKINKTFLFASIILFIGSLIAAISHWIAHNEQDFRFTILGFTSAIFSGMFYGISVEGRKWQIKESNTVTN
ncbi:MAG: hypothetical protein HeimC2_21080 [Candidatus Heimdallarchaeota archaeon LC_2]|nr:MAG: hypothetical protein HeimC2_21080 [Candidatus Heimdallarchaeota archaeon LC_2]